MTPVQRGLKHLFIPLDKPYERKEVEKASGDELRGAVDASPCPACGCTRVLDLKLAGTRCRGCGRDRQIPALPEAEEIHVP